MVSKKYLATVAVILAIVTHYANISVPTTLSSYDSILLRILAFAMDMNTLLRCLPTNAHVHLSNFAWRAFSDLVNVVKSDDPSIRFTDMRVDGDIKIRLYEPVNRKQWTRAGLLFFHGGGLMYGDPEMYHVLTRHLAAELDVVLVSVDYTLTWQAPFPASINDCTKATVWFMYHAKHYSVDLGRIAVAGDSAGGNLAAAVAGRLTFKKEYNKLPKLKFHALIYPALQAFDLNTPSYQQHGRRASSLISKEFLTYGFSYYLAGNSELKQAMFSNHHTSPESKIMFNNLVSHDLIPAKFKDIGYKPSRNKMYGSKQIYEQIKGVLLDPDFAPLMRENLQGLPPAFISTIEEDPARDDGIMYARRLEKAGVQVTWKHYENGIHGMCLLFVDPFSIEAGKKSVQEFISYARAKFKQ